MTFRAIFPPTRALAASLLLAAPAAAQDYQAEPQVPTGKFTTAAEVKPIMAATKGAWVAVREFDGQDLVYVTHIMSWRCGLAGLRFAVNGGALEDWPLPPCDEASAQPGAIPEDAVIYLRFPLGSVQSVEVELVYDDLTRETGAFPRAAVLMN